MCKALYVIAKEKGQIPFPIDRASNDADKVKTGLYRDKKKQKNRKCIQKKDKMMAYSFSPYAHNPYCHCSHLKHQSSATD